MKTLELNEYGVMEMSSEEKQSSDGGWIPVAIVCAFVISAINNWGDIREGWSDGINKRPPRH